MRTDDQPASWREARSASVEVSPGEMAQLTLGLYLHGEPMPTVSIRIEPEEPGALVCSPVHKVTGKDGYKLVWMCQNWGQVKATVTAAEELHRTR